MTQADRKRLQGIMEILISHAAQLDYPTNDVRGKLDATTFALTWTEAQAHLKAGKHLMFDCSGSADCIYKWCFNGKASTDPSGLKYDPKHLGGYTGTMLAHLPHYSNAKRARVGALVVFGPGTGEHVAVVLEADRTNGDPLLFSHGYRGATGPIRLHREARFHDPPVTFLDVSGL